MPTDDHSHIAKHVDGPADGLHQHLVEQHGGEAEDWLLRLESDTEIENAWDSMLYEHKRLHDADPYPESTKMLKAQDTSQPIGEFVDWLGTQGMLIGHHTTIEGYSQPQFVPVPTSIEDLLARYFEIDLVAVDREKRQMLAELRRSPND